MVIANIRLSNQRLTGEKFSNPHEVVNWLGAVQSQDYHMAKWSLGLRMRDATDAKIEESFNKGEILRTHVMRPTWHFILPEDLVWMQELTSSRVKTFMGHYNKKLELTDELFNKSNSAIVKALGEKGAMTRAEIKDVLANIGIIGDVQRYAHIIMWAELDSLICSGPRRGKQFTYALVSKRLPKSKKISREEALYQLTLKYFTSHGPAQLKDFSWWSGLTMKDANEGLSMIKSKVSEKSVNGKIYFSFNWDCSKQNQTTAYLMSIFDEYAISYKDRSDVSDYRDIEKMIMMGNALTAIVVINGKARGTWKKEIKKDKVEIKISPSKKFTHDENIAVKRTADEFGDFLGLEPLLTIV